MHNREKENFITPKLKEVKWARCARRFACLYRNQYDATQGSYYYISSILK